MATSEIATILISGQRIEDWETVWVHIEFPSKWRSFRFSVSEFDPKSPHAQIIPGMECQILLAGQLAVEAFVMERQAYYDANRHSVMVSGQSRVADLTHTSVMKEGGQFTKKPLQQIAQDICKPFGINVVTKGSSQYMNLPFDNAQVGPSESPYQFLERLAKMRACFLGDDAHGNFVIDGGGQSGSGPSLIEGVNIKWARLTANDTSLDGTIQVHGEATATDEKYAKDVTQPKAEAKNPKMQRYKPLKFLAPRSLGPSNMLDELKAAVAFEVAWQESVSLIVEVGLQGWLQSNGQLWDVGQKVRVESPMLPMDQDLIVQQVTFTQSNEEGTNTVLQLVNEVAMNPSQVQATATPG